MARRTAAREELANTLTHGVGLAGSVGAAALLLALAMLSGDAWRITGTAVFATTLVALYAASTLYHGTRHPRIKARLQVTDHCAIYLLIAGTYTPFTLVGLRGRWGWSLFGTVWVLAAAGVVFKLACSDRFPRLSLATYLAMGWLALVAVVPMTRVLAPATLGWIVLGGLAYTVGTAFYNSRRVPFAHAIWHGFVMAGSLCHTVAVGTHILAAAG